MSHVPRPWWKDATVYQIYPASFNDSNNDGVGDIQGIIQKLDYIQSIGVEVIWVCPMYASPQIDMGYDISDYEAVYPPYGTVQDMEVLIKETHRRNMKIILDLVINHTSDQHKWFQESRSSKDNPKRDWYIWRPAKYDSDGNRKPPTNWRSYFGGSVWQWDEHTQEYYLHLFCPEQPDINWENEEARQAVYQSAMISWLDRGVDGFRIDTVNMYSKPMDFPDAPVKDPDTPWQDSSLIHCNGPNMDKYLDEMNAILTRYNAMSVGECPATPDRARVLGYVSAEAAKLNMVFQFDSVDVGQSSPSKYDTAPFNYTLADVKGAICRTQSLLDGTDAWTTSFIENHDQARSISRFGNDSHLWRSRSGKMLAMLFASLSGTLFVYQGQEIGMINMPKDWPIEEYKDVDSINFYAEAVRRKPDDAAAHAFAKAGMQHLSRDHARTPMQWTSEFNAAFTSKTVEPWMRVNTSAQEGINVEEEHEDPSSVLNFWRRMLKVRKTHAETLVHGNFQLVDGDNEKVFSFVKTSPDGKVKALVMCNFADVENRVPAIDGVDTTSAKVLLDNVSDHLMTDTPVESEAGYLQPWEGRIYLLESGSHGGNSHENDNAEHPFQNHQPTATASPNDADSNHVHSALFQSVLTESQPNQHINQSSPQSFVDDAYFTFDDFAQNILSSTVPLQGQRLIGDRSLLLDWNGLHSVPAVGQHDISITSPSTWSDAPDHGDWREIEHGVGLFFDKMYAVYPVMDKNHLRSLLDTPPQKLQRSELRLLWSICALTLMAVDAWPTMELEKRTTAARQYIKRCLEDRISSSYIEHATVEDVLASLFIAVTYFDLKCRKNAWFYVREAITLAQAADMHTVENDLRLQPAERLRRQRIYALLFISERGACIHDTFSISILSSPTLPCERLPEEDPSVSIGLSMLFHLFSLLDSNFFRARNDLTSVQGTGKEYIELATLQEQLHQVLDLTNVSETQRADVLVTQQWLRLMVWQTALRLGLISSAAMNPSYTYAYPIHIASSLCEALKTLSSAAIEVHGLGIFEKQFEIAYSLLDALTLSDGTQSQDHHETLRSLLESLSASPKSRDVYVRILQKKMGQDSSARKNDRYVRLANVQLLVDERLNQRSAR
ncbi:alpha-glucosidase [Aureobasidium sp. EXF-10728]|nr:alpha-glucosidase [Aureobasidium sp. EXF-10728]